jgi:hypothetical protein
MPVQKLLIALQIALAVLLSGSAVLMVRSLLALTSIETGVQADGVLRAQIGLPDGSYRADGQVWSFYDRLLERVRALSNVTHAAVMSGLPPRRGQTTRFSRRQGARRSLVVHQVSSSSRLSGCHAAHSCARRP